MSETRTALPDDDLVDGHTRRGRVLTAVVGLALVAVGVALLLSVYDLHRVRTATMLPSVPVSGVGVYLPVDDGDVRRGDIVRYRSDWPEAQGFDELTFRVLATGGERIVGRRDGTMEVDGQVLEEPYLDDSAPRTQDPFDVTVPEGRLFVVGDARGVANDSRNHLQDGSGGSVPVDAVSGRLVGVAWPVWDWSVIDDERGRPWPFVIGSLLVAAGSLALLVVAARAAGSAVGALGRWRRDRRSSRAHART